MASCFVNGWKAAGEMVKALGITRPVRSITMKFDCKEAASVTVEFVPELDDMGGITDVIGQYKLVPKGAD